MNLRFLTSRAYDLLTGNLKAPQDLSLYLDSNLEISLFLKKHYPDENFECTPVSRIIVNEIPQLLERGITSEDEKSLQDLANVRIVHAAFKNLPANVASNKYLWTYLSHCVYRPYIRARWLALESNDPVKTIKTRFFVSDTKSSLFDNAISRLWWYGHITYEETGGDHYVMTKILLRSQQFCTDVVDASYSKNRIVTKSVLRAFAKFEAKYGCSEKINGYLRKLNPYLSRYGAVTCLDALSPDAIERLVKEFIERLHRSQL